MRSGCVDRSLCEEMRRNADRNNHKGEQVMYAKSIAGPKAGTLAMMGLLLVVGPSHAQQGWPINNPSSSSSFPWNSPGYQGYNEPRYAATPIIPSAPMGQPQKYGLYINALPLQNTDDPNA